MSRISHQTPMNAYDHVARLLTEAGGKDGRISRKDAEGLVDKLRAEGRGTEALAAQNIFKMIDARDAKAGAKVTGYDLEASRGFVADKMLENRDVNKNGYSQAEVKNMSPTARALIELGQVLEMDAAMGRVAHRVPEKGLEHIAAFLSQAVAGDGIASRADAEKLFDGLYKEGRGTEKLAAEYFYRFMDHRDAGEGNRITQKDIDKAVSYAREKLLRNKDENANGYSKDEISEFSTTAKAFLMVGQMIEAGLIKSLA